MATEKQIEANRKNAQKSTGPKTAEGKARSRLNALKHGLTGKSDVLPPDDLELYKERLHGWNCDARPEGEIEMYLIATAALAAVRLDRSARHEIAAIRRRRKRAVAGWTRKQDRIVAACVRRLARDPGEAVAELEAHAQGCLWLADAWADLALALDQAGGWTPDQADRALLLLVEDHDADAPSLVELVRSAQNSDGAFSPEDRQQLLAAIEQERARLVERAEALWNSDEAEDLADTIDLATFDASRRGQLRRRYETACTLDMHRALNQFARHRKEGRRDKWEGSATPIQPPPTYLLGPVRRDDLTEAGPPPSVPHSTLDEPTPAPRPKAEPPTIPAPAAQGAPRPEPVAPADRATPLRNEADSRAETASETRTSVESKAGHHVAFEPPGSVPGPAPSPPQEPQAGWSAPSVLHWPT